MFPPEITNGNGFEPDRIEDIDLSGNPDTDAMTAALGVAVRTNAKRAAAATDAGQAKDFAQAALYASQAINGLVPYADPEAGGDKQTNNPAKKGD